MTRLTFRTAPYGLDPITDFTLDRVEDSDGLFKLVADDGTRLYLLDTQVHLPTYAPKLTAEHYATVGGADQLLRVLVVVTPTAEEWTVNLAAPILVGVDGVAAQVILDGADWPIRFPLT